ncbi:MAG TPA: family 16 glycoside hydrolase [Cyclobacteriaceae bacterium]|nr:family 16 glycoside hydrolase [Cyclobacteriaceae bacterium]
MKYNLFFLLFIAAITSCGPRPDQDGWYSLFDGESLNGWTASENQSTFSIEDGAMVAHGDRSHLYYTGDVNKGTFKNFEFSAEVRTSPGSNSGIYFHTAFQEEGWPSKGYEVQVNNSFIGNPEHPELKKTGSLYAIRNKYLTFVNDDEWFTMQVIVKGKRVKIMVNDKYTVDYLEPENPYRPEEMKGRLIGEGTFALQGHDPNSKVYFRNLRVKPLPDDAIFDDPRESVPEDIERKITMLHSIGFPMMDLHVHLKGGLTMEQALEQSRIKGIDYGIAVNCGLDFYINTDERLLAHIDSVKREPAFNAMQAEGREWVEIFSKDAVKTFDYIFTDAMTFNNLYGKRVHLWIPEEVNIPNKEKFMDQLADYIVKIISEESINVYANATYIPDIIAGEYDKLWTKPRMQKVIKAAKAKGVAIEISARYKIPSFEFIRLAKSEGVKFTFGTNNTDANLGYDEYCLQAIDSCGLTPDDMWVPGW